MRLQLPPDHPLKAYIVQVALWLPLVFMGWFYMAPVLTLPLRLALNTLMPDLYPQAISAIEQDARRLNVVTEFSPPPTAGISLPEGKIGVLVFEVNPLMYGYGFPLYTALVLAALGTGKEKGFKWIAGLLILFPIQAWEVFFETLKTILFRLGPEIQSQMAFTDLQLELVALAYQFGYLILPAVSPVVIWLWFHRRFIVELAPNLAGKP